MSSFLSRRVEFLSVLRIRDFRIYYFGMLSSVTGHLMLVAAQGWLVYDLVGVPAALGFVAGAQAVPGLLVNLLAGALADRMDPRRLILFAQASAGVLTVLLATVTLFGEIAVWHILVFAFLIGTVLSIDQPARRTVWPALVPRDQFIHAASLNQTVWNGTRVFAPALALGTIAVVDRVTGDARLGAAIAFYASTLGFAGIVVAVLMIKIPQIRRSTGATVLHDIRDGLVFVVRNRVFLMLLLLTFTIGFFGLSFHQLMPALAKDDLNVGPSGLGLILSVGGVGGIAGIFVAASFGAYQSRSWVMVGGAFLLGASVLALAVSSFFGSFAFAMVFVGLASAFWTVFQVSTNVVLNLLVPEEFRGRVMGLRSIIWSLSPLGALLGGVIATWANSTPFAIGLGGGAILVITLSMYVLSSDLRHVRELVEEVDAERAERGADGRPARV